MQEGEQVSFPTEGILPKSETGASDFIRDNNTWDGRGIKVAIFDTGVDPGAAGLQVTTEGKPKVVDVIDCTGSGDIRTEATNVKDLDRPTLKGLSGRMLSLGPWYKNSTRMRLGLKRGYELFPDPLTKRVKKERKEAFMKENAAAIARAQRALSDFDKENGTTSEDAKKKRKDMEKVVSLLQDAADSYDDAGPVFDCVVFEEGGVWRAVIDTDCTGDMTKATPLASYSEERQFSTIHAVPGTKEESLLLNYCVNIFDDGEIVSIVCDAGSHGTHVAGIVAAHHPGRPELDGIAPGAQIVSCKIGDSRMGSIETGTGLVRALIAARDRGCQLINMSYGESFVHAEGGRFAALATEFVEREGIIFVTSAGNNGPALSTVGAPGGTCSALISIGAHVSPGMMEVEYSLRETVPPTNYTWSSRGPTPDGHRGVSVCAPGGAIAPVPTWTLQGQQLMNGTSMSSPNACGGIALLLSALMAQKVPYTPALVRRAIENSAKAVAGIEPWALGTGLLHIPSAYTLLSENHDYLPARVTIEARIPGRNNSRGLYLRNAQETDKIVCETVMVTPSFHEDCDNHDQVNFSARVTLSSTSPEWCQAPAYLALGSKGKGFEIRVDPTKIPEGTAAFCEVLGTDSDRPGLGPLFRFPVTVVRPELPPTGEYSLHFNGITYRPGTIDRHFIAVPTGATWMDVTVKTGPVEGSHILVVHSLQVVSGCPPTGRNHTELDEYLRLKPHSTITHKIAVEGGLTTELCITKWWASLGTVVADVEVTFHGAAASPNSLAISSGEPVVLDVTTALRNETVKPSVSLTHLCKTLVPTKHIFKQSMSPRDALPRGRHIMELVLSYSFEQTEKEPVKVQPRAPMFELLYDSPYESQLWVMLDSNKSVMGVGDALYQYPTTLQKGKYTIQFLVRHDDKALLDKLKSMPLVLSVELAKPVKAEVFSNLQDALTGTDPTKGGIMPCGARKRFFVAPPSSRVPGSKYGDILTGQLSFGCGKEGTRRVGTAGMVSVAVGPEPAKESDEKVKEDDKTEEEIELDERRAGRVKRLKTLREEKKWASFDGLVSSLKDDNATHIPFLEEVLARWAAASKASGGTSSDLDTDAECAQAKLCAIQAANDILAAADIPALAAHFGVNHDTEVPETKKLCDEMNKKKAALVKALLVRAEVFLSMLSPSSPCVAAAGCEGSISAVVKDQEITNVMSAYCAELEQWWVEADRTFEECQRHAVVTSGVRWRQGRFGASGNIIFKALKSKEGPPCLATWKEWKSLAGQMQWAHIERYIDDKIVCAFPHAEPLL